MPFKPISQRNFEQYLKMVGWNLEKGGIDWNLYDENGCFVCSIKISHGSRTNHEVTAVSVKKVECAFKKRDFVWPPQKKLKKN